MAGWLQVEIEQLFLREEMSAYSQAFDMPTVIQVLANSLSTLTILSCLFMKVPQILYIREKKSAEGIFIQALLMEIVGFSIMTLYNYTSNYGLMTYMEYPIILFQVYIMLYYVLKYKGMVDLPIVPLCTAIYFATVAGFLLDILPKSILCYLVPLCTPMSGFAKVTYIYGIIKTGNADNVSLTTWIISMLTNLARIFTVYVDSADQKLIINFAISTVLSFGVLGTAIFYKKQRPAPAATANAAPQPQRVKTPVLRRRSHND